jgi:hypothetical protein
MVYPSISPLERILPKTMRALSEVIHDIAPRFGWSGDALGMLEANPEIAVAIAAGEIWSTSSMAKWIYKKGKSFVTPNKKRKKGAPSTAPRSQLPAQPKGDMPFGNKRRREWNDITSGKRFRPRSTMKRNNRVTGHYRKSKMRKRYQDPRGVVNVYDDHDDIASDNALYLYAQDFGSSDRAMKIGTQAIVKAALATIFVYPTNPYYLCTTASPENDLQIRFRRTYGVDPSYEDQDAQVTVNGQTFEAVCDSLGTIVKTKAADGYYPYAFRFEGGDRGNEYRSLGDSIITMTVSTTMQIQNTTLADSGQFQTHGQSITANPLKGKIYKTRGFVPYVRPGVVHNNSSLAGFHESPGSGVNQAVFVSDTSMMNHPPVGTSLFRHCTGSRNVKMQAGSIMPVRSYFKTRMTILNFFKKVGFLNWSHPNMFGTCTVLGLEQSMRSVADESVKIGFNREVTMKAHVRLKRRVTTIHSYTSSGVIV